MLSKETIAWCSLTNKPISEIGSCIGGCNPDECNYFKLKVIEIVENFEDGNKNNIR